MSLCEVHEGSAHRPIRGLAVPDSIDRGLVGADLSGNALFGPSALDEGFDRFGWVHEAMLCGSALLRQCVSAFDPTGGISHLSPMDKLRENITTLMGGRTEKSVAEAAQIDQTWLNRVMNPQRIDGIRHPRDVTLQPLAAYFGVTVQELRYGVPVQAPRLPPQSHPLRLDPVILAESIAALRQVARNRGWSYDPQLHAETTCYAYELWHELPSEASNADVIDLGERIAERLRMELEKTGGGNQQGSSEGAGSTDRSKSGQQGVRKTRVSGGAK